MKTEQEIKEEIKQIKKMDDGLFGCSSAIATKMIEKKQDLLIEILLDIRNKLYEPKR